MALKLDAAKTVRVSKTNGTECPNDFCDDSGSIQYMLRTRVTQLSSNRCMIKPHYHCIIN